MSKSFIEKSYEAHARLFDDHARGGKEREHAMRWLDDGTVDAWRHRRMYASLDPFIEHDPGAKWLTVGDGRYATDAGYLLAQGAQALASDISETLLKEAFEAGHIPGYAVENAEAISFDHDAFDYVFCKEAYHHFPRPTVALHEMLRVARKAVVLIEPNDRRVSDSLRQTAFTKCKDALKALLGRSTEPEQFEEAGNYVYSISRREMRKVALGMNLRHVAFKCLGDYYLAWASEEHTADDGPGFRRVRRYIGLQDWLRRLGLEDSRLLVAVVFKHPPEPALTRALRHAGYETIELPENPYAPE